MLGACSDKDDVWQGDNGAKAHDEGPRLATPFQTPRRDGIESPSNGSVLAAPLSTEGTTASLDPAPPRTLGVTLELAGASKEIWIHRPVMRPPTWTERPSG